MIPLEDSGSLIFFNETDGYLALQLGYDRPRIVGEVNGCKVTITFTPQPNYEVISTVTGILLKSHFRKLYETSAQNQERKVIPNCNGSYLNKLSADEQVGEAFVSERYSG